MCLHIFSPGQLGFVTATKSAAFFSGVNTCEGSIAFSVSLTDPGVRTLLRVSHAHRAKLKICSR